MYSFSDLLFVAAVRSNAQCCYQFTEKMKTIVTPVLNENNLGRTSQIVREEMQVEVIIQTFRSLTSP